jgi:hypothetical protein
MSAIEALGLSDGVFHFETFGDHENMFAGELACRPGGGLISDLVRHAYDVNLWEEHWRSIAKVPPNYVIHSSPYNFGFVHLPTVAGEINRFDSKSLRSREEVVYVHEMCSVGDLMPAMSESSSSCLAYVLIKGASQDDVRQSILNLIDEARKTLASTA